jgi:hypothetical protein
MRSPARHHTRLRALSAAIGLAAILASVLGPSPAAALPLLGSAQSFAVLGHDSVSNGHAAPDPFTQVYGDLGVTPGNSIQGFFPEGTVARGRIHLDDDRARQSMTDATAAYGALAGLSPTQDLTGHLLGSPGYGHLTPGVYHFDSAADLAGTLTLDFLGNPDATFVFQIGDGLTTAANSRVDVIHGGTRSSVYWLVGGSATVGTDATFAGNLLASGDVELDARARVLCGRVFGLNGGVTMMDNLVTNNIGEQDVHVQASDFGSYGFSGGTGGELAPIPEPSTWILLGVGLAGLLAFRWRSRGRSHATPIPAAIRPTRRTS